MAALRQPALAVSPVVSLSSFSFTDSWSSLSSKHNASRIKIFLRHNQDSATDLCRRSMCSRMAADRPGDVAGARRRGVREARLFSTDGGTGTTTQARRR